MISMAMIMADDAGLVDWALKYGYFRSPEQMGTGTGIPLMKKAQ